MKKPIVYMDSSVAVDINLPYEKIDLKKWFYEMTDSDYRSFSSAHLAMGISSLPGGESVFINLEKSGKTILLHHYVPDVSKKNQVRVISEKSNAFSGSRTFVIRVIWELTITPVTSSTSRLTNHVTVATESKIVAWIGKRTGSKATDMHNREECILFARDIENKFS